MACPRWTAETTKVRDGYTALLPVPGDLPVFLHLAAAVIAAQDPADCHEVLVVPDVVDASFRRAFSHVQQRFDWRPMRLVELGYRARAFQRASAYQPTTNYFLQVMHGARAATTTHVLFHDADLFIDDSVFLREHFRMCRNEGVGCLGVSPVWDEWLLEHGAGHLVATWELMASTRWLRSFPAWQHRPHLHPWAGEMHAFDVTLLPQALSAPDVCQLNPHDDSGLLHFNHVLGIYRKFQRATEYPFEDRRFHLLLVRALVDGFAEVDVDLTAHDDLPPVAELERGLTDDPGRISYTSEHAKEYGHFRKKIDRLAASAFVGPERAERILRIMKPFDDAFNDPQRLAGSGAAAAR